jgi:protein-tyrosine phosphatase
MHKILFVCTGNQYRSPIAAEAFRDQLVQDGRDAEWIVNSAGTWPSSGQPPPPEAVELAQAHGLIIDRHRSRLLTASMLREADLVIVMEEGHKESIKTEFPFAREKVYLLSQVVEGIAYDIPDPALAKEDMRAIIGDLVAMIQEGYLKICSILKAD